MFKSPKHNGGFTLIETLFSAAIFVIIVGVMSLFFKNTWVYNAFLGSSLTGINSGRAALKTIVAEIRTASSGSDGAYAISAATATSFTFYSDIYNDGRKEKIRYFLENNQLKKGVIIPTGSPLAYTGTETITTLISNVTSTSIFNYYDKNYDGTTAALSLPVDVSNIRLVKITVTIDDNPNRAPGTITVSSQVTLRNIKDNL
jgi:type II secretory pathway pseudopilin PulG